MSVVAGVGSLLASIPPPPGQELELGPLRLRYYGLCIALGVLAAVWIARRRWGRWGGDPEDFVTIALIAVPAGLIGARIYHVVTDWSDKYSSGRWWPDALMVWKGGLGIPGGVLLGAIAGIAVCFHLGVSWRRAADAAAPAIPVAQAIGRLGNYFNQELFGRPTDLPWGLEVDVQHRPVDYLGFSTFHPTFLYELLWNLALAGGIVLGGRRVVLRRGKWFAVYVAGYGLGRLWVEALRSDDATKLFGMRVNIWTALIALAGGLVWLFWGGSPVDHDATQRRREGVPESELFAADTTHGGSRADGPEAAAVATATAGGPDADLDPDGDLRTRVDDPVDDPVDDSADDGGSPSV